MKRDKTHSAKKEIERGAESLGRKVTMRYMRDNQKRMVHHQGVYVGYVDARGTFQMNWKIAESLGPDTASMITERVERKLKEDAQMVS